VGSLRIEKLQRIHAIDAFDCGRETLNLFLIRYAFQNQQAEASQTYLALSDEELVGYYTIVVGQVEYNDDPERLTKGLARHPVPIMLLARLAVATSWQGKGIGAGFLKDAMLRTLQAADIAGIRAFAVHAKDDEARTFYEHFDFVLSPSDPFHLFRLFKDLRKLLRSEPFTGSSPTSRLPVRVKRRPTSQTKSGLKTIKIPISACEES
jgi:GNAT superfamily N-acetyltransferase